MDNVFRKDFLPPLFAKFLQVALDEKGNFPHLILYGPPGTGKSTALQYLKRNYINNRSSIKHLDLNAAQDEKALEKVMSFVKHAHPIPGQFNLLILEEADYMPRANQAKLRHIIETHTDCIRFLFTCNELHRILSPIQSRCFCFRFAALYKMDAPDVNRAMLTVAKGDIRHLKRLLDDPDAVRDKRQLSITTASYVKDIHRLSFEEWWDIISRYNMITVIEEAIKIVDPDGKDELVDIAQSFRQLRGFDQVTGWQVYHCVQTHKLQAQ